MAGRHVGIDIGVRVDNSVFDSVDRRIDKVKANAEQLNRVLSRTKMPDSATNGLDKLNRASGETRTQIDRLANSYKQVGSNNNLNRAQSDLSGIADKAKKATESTDQLKQSMNRAHESSKALGDMGSGFDRARGSSDRARESFDKTTSSSNKLKSGWDRLKGAGSALVQVGSSIATAMVPVAAAFMKANSEATKLADEYNVIKNLQETGGDSPRAARRNTREIQAENRRLSLRYGVDQNELARGSEQLIRRGYSGQQDLAAHKYFLQAARATNEDYNSIVNSAAPMLEQFGYKSRAGNSVRRMSKYTRDVLNKAAYVADLTSGDVGGESGFGESFKMMGSAAHSNGQTIDTMLGALGTLSNYGEEGSSAGTGMRQIITRLIKAPHSTAMLGALHDLGINPNSLYTRNGHLKQLGTIFEMLNRASRGKKSNRVSSDLQTLFGQTGFNDAQILMNHYGDMQHNVRESQNAARTGYISRLSRKNMSSLQNQLARTKQLATDMGMSFAKEVAPGISKALGYANKLLEAMRGMPKPVKTAAAYITGILGTLGASKLASGFLKANFGIGNGKGIGAGIGRLLFGKETGVRPRDPVTGQYIKGSSRQGGLINALKGNSFGGAFKLGRVQPGELTGKALVGRRLLGGAVGVGTALDVGYQGFQAYKDRHNAAKRSVDIGGAVGTGAGAIVGGIFGGPIGAAIGSQLGKAAGKWGGAAVNNFTKGWQRNKPPKKFWSMENLGWSTKDMFSKMGKGWNSFWGGMGNWRKKEASGWNRWTKQTGSGLNRWATNVGKGWNRGVKGVGKWFRDIPSNLGKTGKSIGRWAVNAGNSIHKGWSRGVEASHNFFKNLPKNFDRTKKNIGKWASQTGKNISNWSKRTGKSIASWSSRTGRNISKAWNRGKKATANFVKGIPGNLAKAGKSVQNWGSRTGRSIQRTWNKGVNGVKRFVGGIPGQMNRAHKSVDSWASRTGRSIQSAWNAGKKGLTSFITSIPGQLAKVFKAVKEWASNVGSTISKAWNNFWGKAGDIKKGITNNLKGFGNDLNRAAGGSGKAFKYEKIKSHATGGFIGSAHRALVGEAGPELAYRAGSNARLLGANGPAITQVHPGEHILNARDTRKVMAGGLGRGLTLKGYASGNTKLGQTQKTVSKDYKKISDDATKSLRKLNKNNTSSWSKIRRTSSKSVNAVQSHNNSTWRKITNQTAKYNSKTRANATKEYTGMRKSVHKQMDNMHDGVISTANSTSKGFGKAMGKMRSYAKDAMGDTIDQLNRGIRGIDKVLSQFGGNGSVIKPVHFAQGSDANGRLMQNTLSVVNDAQSGPRQEALVSPSNELYFPHGDNVHLMIPRGWGVLNGSQTQQVAKKAGLQHFAKGSGVNHSQLRKIAEKAGSDPSKWFKNNYTNDIKSHGSDLNKGTTALGSNSSTKFGNPWSNAMWGVINHAIDSGDGGSINATGLLKAVERYGEGHRYVWGATGPSTFDCSGLVKYALKKAYGIDYPHFSGSQYAMTQHISKSQAHMGDLVFWGHNGGDHVGVYAGGDKYFSAESPSQGIHMNTLSSVVGKGAPIFGRVKGMPSQKAKPKYTQKADSRLTALAKRELGPAALKWIKNNLGDTGGYGNPVGDGVKRWRKYIVRAAEQMHTSVNGTQIAKILSMISGESGGNPTITQQIHDINSANGDPAQGLLQFIPPTFNAYAAKGHHNIKNGYDQLLALFNDRNWRSDIHFGGGWGPTGGRRFARGGNHYGSGTYLVGEEGPELLSTDGKAHIDNHDQTKKKLGDLFDDLKVKKIKPIKVHRPNSPKPVINININGPISSTQDAHRVANIVRQEIAHVFENAGDEFGLDPTVY